MASADRPRGAISNSPAWREHAANLVERVGLEARVVRLEFQVASLVTRASGNQSAPVVVPLSTLAPEPFAILAPIHVLVQEGDDGFVASLLDANLGASGETMVQAIDGLKDRIVTTFERLEAKADDKLGPGPLRQKHVLAALIGRR